MFPGACNKTIPHEHTRYMSAFSVLVKRYFNNFQKSTLLWKICKKSVPTAGENNKFVSPLEAKTQLSTLRLQRRRC